MRIFRLSGSSRRDPTVRAWFEDGDDGMRLLAETWFDRMKSCGEDVFEVLHDRHPTACVSGAAFSYVAAFREHVNVGFFQGAELKDPKRLLEGAGQSMRHVKLRWGHPIDEQALSGLIKQAYEDVRQRLSDPT